ncbi:MAG: ribosome maturation factor RimM [Deltaproteobacteria bacterium]|jgi:16S rRNA processing protein RimM|nr:ribosome maturation factor RimM [Deltaproteobacteria bacterium]
MGTLTRAHGLKGELRVEWHADSPLRVMRLYVRVGAETPRTVRVESVRMDRGRPLVLLEGVRDRTEAEKLRGAGLLLPEAELPETSAEEVRLFQLPGLAVVLSESGRSIGHIDHVEFPGGKEVWAIRAEGGRELLFPAEAPFVLSVDLEKGRVFIDPPPGLLEIYLGGEPPAAQ